MIEVLYIDPTLISISRETLIIRTVCSLESYEYSSQGNITHTHCVP